MKAQVKPTRSYQKAEVALGLMKVNARAQRELREYRVKELAADFDFDMMGEPVLNWVGNGVYHIIDGQHRVEALKVALGDGWEKFTIPCRVYKGLSDEEEADMFDRLDNVLAVSAWDKFHTRVTAKREIECAVSKCVSDEGLTIKRPGHGYTNGAVTAIATLIRIYKRSDGETLKKTLRIVRDAFGDTGLEARILDGIGLVCHRYNGAIKESAAVERLSTMRGGASGLIGKAVTLHKQTGNSMAQCVAATAVEVINRGRGGKKLPSWWSQQVSEETEE